MSLVRLLTLVILLTCTLCQLAVKIHRDLSVVGGRKFVNVVVCCVDIKEEKKSRGWIIGSCEQEE